MKLYHASTAVVEIPDLSLSRDKLDFGRGFYLTKVREQAVHYAERYTRRGLDAYVNEYELDDDTPGFSFKHFESYDEEWLDYVALCRKGLMSQTAFDAVSGGVANDKVFNTIDLYFAGVVSKEEALGKLRFERPNHQICLLNKQMIEKHLHFIKAEKIGDGGK